MRVEFIGVKQIGGFCGVDTAERDLYRYIAELNGKGVVFTITEFGNDATTGWLVETGCPPNLQQKASGHDAA